MLPETVPDIKLADLLAKRRELEVEICTYLSDRINKFVEETGITIRDINFRIIDVSSIGKPRQFIIGDVRIVLSL